METKKACYKECNPDETFEGWGKCVSLWYEHYTLVGFQFTNKNKFMATIEAEWWTNYRNELWMRQTKSFVLEAGEAYIWKVELKGNGSVNHPDHPDYSYVKFKAFKDE